MSGTPCAKCPWEANDPDITPVVRAAAEAGKVFCCHVRMGTCWGAVKQGAGVMEGETRRDRKRIGDGT